MKLTSISRGFIVDGGALGAHGWALKSDQVSEVEGRAFFVLSKRDPNLRKFVGVQSKSQCTKHFGTLDAIVNARNVAQQEWTEKELAAQNPNHNNVIDFDRVPYADKKRARSSMPTYLDVAIEGAGTCTGHTMTVLTSKLLTERCAIEITNGNLDWLQRAVHDGAYQPRHINKSKSRETMSAIGPDCKDVRWNEKRRVLWTAFEQEGKCKRLSKKISECSDEERALKKLKREAETLQSLRNTIQDDSDEADEVDG